MPPMPFPGYDRSDVPELYMETQKNVNILSRNLGDT